MDAYDEEKSSVVQSGCDRVQLLLPVTGKQTHYSYRSLNLAPHIKHI